MKSIFHVKCDTAEELRQELLANLEWRKNVLKIEVENSKTVGGKNINIAKWQIVTEILDFYKELIIDAKEPAS
jgi:hypothetical protein